jgi:outer membrane biosynthesis protein TonB
VHADSNRVLAYAAFLSIACHALLLFGWPHVQERLRAPRLPPVIARLVEPKMQEPAPTPPPEPRPAEKKAPAAHKRETPQVPSPVRVPAPFAKEVPAPVVEAPVVQSVETAPREAPQAVPVAAARVDDTPTTIAQYRLQVILAASRMEASFPTLIQDSERPGKVVVAMDVGLDGGAQPKLKASSGYAPLDERAVELFRKAASSVPLPAPLHGKAFSFEVTAVSRVKD